MSNEEQVRIVRRAVAEDKRELAVAGEVTALEDCTAKCPTCQQTCEYTAGHSGLHQCPNRHEWV
jgi:hypothetical protein